MKLGLVLFLSIIAYSSWGQTDTLPEVKKDTSFLQQLSQPNFLSGGSVHISGDPRIDQLLRLTMSVNRRESSFQGFRIQILSRSSYNADMESLQRFTEEFSLEFPDIPIYLQYFEPDFKIRVGNFRTRLETIPTLKRIRKKYPNGYPVKTIIYLKEMNQDEEKEETTDPLPSTSQGDLEADVAQP